MENNKNLFDQWDNAFDTEGLQKDIQEAAENGGNRKEIPHDKYEVAVEKMELTATKVDKTSDNPKKHKARPMVSIWFKIVSEGEHKGSMIFYNQVVEEGFQIHIVNELVRSMVKNCVAPTVEFKNYNQYANMLMDIHEMIADSFEYALDYSVNKKGYDVYKIKEVYALED